jgi:hypothetical protein
MALQKTGMLRQLITPSPAAYNCAVAFELVKQRSQSLEISGAKSKPVGDISGPKAFGAGLVQCGKYIFSTDFHLRGLSLLLLVSVSSEPFLTLMRFDLALLLLLTTRQVVHPRSGVILSLRLLVVYTRKATWNQRV